MLDAELVRRVSLSSGLSAGEAARIIHDVVAFYAEPTPSYVRRRHARLQSDGLKNDEIFRRIRGELASRVVAPPELSERQLRRIVYG